MSWARGRKAGRKRAVGERYPNGRLKPTAEALALKRPNPRVLAERRALLGEPGADVKDCRRAENPLDCLEARGWLSPELARAGHAYAALYRRAGHVRPRVTLIVQDAGGSPSLDAPERSDTSPLGPGGQGPDGDPEAVALLNEVWRHLDPRAGAELNSVCIHQAWPFWAVQKICGRSDADIPDKWLRRRGDLTRGLEIVRGRLAPARPASAPGSPRDVSPVQVEEWVQYVDEAGRPDPVRNAARREVEVVRLRRRGPRNPLQP